MKKKLSFLFVTVWFLNVYSQTTFPNNGAPYKPHTLFAFINAQLVIDYEITINNGVLLVKDGKIIASGNNVSIPKHAVIIDLKGKFIYPSFIDIYSDYGLNEIKASRRLATDLKQFQM
jgi:imidazolonepropionase-like amidohydrolase